MVCNTNVCSILIFFSTGIASLAAMENKQEFPNQALVNAVEIATKNNFSLEDLEKIKECLQKGANPNYKFTEDEITLLMLAVEYAKQDLFYFLLNQGADINATDKLGRTVLYRFLKMLYTKSGFDIQMCKILLSNGANPNTIIQGDRFQQTSLSLAVYSGRSDVVKLLINSKADVNQKDARDATALGWAIYRSKVLSDMNLKVIKKLCNAGVSLLNINKQGSTVFHLMVGKQAELIRTFLAYARFDDNSYKEIDNQMRDQQIKERIIETLVVLRTLRIPEEIQFRILAKLPINYFYYADRGLCRLLLQKGYKHPYISAQINKRVEWLESILAISNDKGTALENLHKEYPYNINYKNKVQSLFEGTKLQKDMQEFVHNKEFSKDNLICLMYHNCSKLLEKKLLEK